MTPRGYLLLHWKLLASASLLFILVSLYLTNKQTVVQLIDWAQYHADSYWLILALIVLQIILFTLALPGSAVLWATAPIYPPLTATFILVTGATLGGCSAYLFSRFLGKRWYAEMRDNSVFKQLEQNSNFLTILSLRLIPGFPQSLTNYSAGILHIPLLNYALASAVGLLPKTLLYTYTIHEAVNAGRQGEIPNWKDLAILLILAMFILAIRLRLLLKQKPH